MTALKTFSLTLIPKEDQHGVPRPAFLLEGEPIANNATDHARWIGAIKGVR
jgi:hypothetical protein